MFIDQDPDTIAQNEADDHAAYEAAAAHDELINNPIYIAGVAEGLRQAAMKRTAEAQSIFNACTRVPTPTRSISILNHQEAF